MSLPRPIFQVEVFDPPFASKTYMKRFVETWSGLLAAADGACNEPWASVNTDPLTYWRLLGNWLFASSVQLADSGFMSLAADSDSEEKSDGAASLKPAASAANNDNNSNPQATGPVTRVDHEPPAHHHPQESELPQAWHTRGLLRAMALTLNQLNMDEPQMHADVGQVLACFMLAQACGVVPTSTSLASVLDPTHHQELEVRGGMCTALCGSTVSTICLKAYNKYLPLLTSVTQVLGGDDPSVRLLLERGAAQWPKLLSAWPVYWSSRMTLDLSACTVLCLNGVSLGSVWFHHYYFDCHQDRRPQSRWRLHSPEADQHDEDDVVHIVAGKSPGLGVVAHEMLLRSGSEQSSSSAQGEEEEEEAFIDLCSDSEASIDLGDDAEIASPGLVPRRLHFESDASPLIHPDDTHADSETEDDGHGHGHESDTEDVLPITQPAKRQRIGDRSPSR